MSIGLRENQIYPGELCFKYDGYWHTWNRVLHIDVGGDWYWHTRNRVLHIEGGTRVVEFSLTPINPSQRDSWVEQVFPIMIRCHRTAIDLKRDKLYRHISKNKHSVVFQEVKRAMIREVPIELMHRMLNEDFLNQIDWFRYLEAQAISNGGGIPFALCKKE